MQLPEILIATLPAADRPWLVRFSEDLAQAVLSGPSLSEPCQGALLRLLPAQTDERPWRAFVDVRGVQLCVAVLPEKRVLMLGSERFASEQLMLQATPQPHDGEAQRRWLALQELVVAWQTAHSDTPKATVEVALAAAELQSELQIATGEHPQAQAIWNETARLAALVNRPMRAYRPGFRENLNQWGLELASNCEPLRLHGLRFVAGLPALDHDQRGAEVARLLGQMLAALQHDSEQAAQTGDTQGTLPWWLAIGVAIGAWLVRILPASWIAQATRTAARLVARTFIAGQDMDEAAPALAGLRASGRDATLDQLGELVVSEPEADVYCERVLGLVRAAGTGFAVGERNCAGIERAHVSVKVSALCSDYDPDDEDGTWLRVGPRLTSIFVEAHQRQVFINLDAEHYSVRNLTFAMLRRALDGTPQLRTWTGAGIVMQAYLRDAAEHCREVIAYARQRGVRMPLRLVKGAYWDAETIESDAHDHPAPQFLDKNETDVMYQSLSLHILAQGDVVQLCVGSHNLRDHCFAEAARSIAFASAPPVEHQALHMTYEALSTAMAQYGWAVRNYVPVGSLLVGMAYLVRRILENSSQVGVLTAARHGVDLNVLMQPPLALVRARHARGELPRDPQLTAAPAGHPPEFYNTAPLRLYHPDHRAVVDEALQSFEKLTILDVPGRSGAPVTVRSPSNQQFVVGELASHTPEDVAAAVVQARVAAPLWAAKPAGVRATCLVRAAELMRCQRPELAALIMHESGKSRAEALGDVDEAIDFLQFYAREALRSADEFPQAAPRGVLAVVAPWNFPLAIPCGMASAALVAGNTVLLKSAEQTPLVVERLVQLLYRAGVPHAALHHLVGDGPSVGAPLVQNADVDGVVFTGSKAVGTMLHRTMATRVRGPATALAITEMGGKNAIVVTGNADLDEAVSGALRSAFGHAGQKCSAASRVLIDQRIFEPFCARFAKAAADWRVGLAHVPGTRINPVVSLEDQARLRRDAELVIAEALHHGGQVLVDRSRSAQTLDLAEATVVGPVVVTLPASAAMQADSHAQRELFGPIVHLIPVADLDEALALWRAPAYSLTGGIYAQSQDDTDYLRDHSYIGNLYINRVITGARVAVEPFGGFRMSGTGPKAGGRDYLGAMLTLPAADLGVLDDETLKVLGGLARLAPHPAHSEHGSGHSEHDGHAHAPHSSEAMWAAWQNPSNGANLDADAAALVAQTLAWSTQHLHGLETGSDQNRAIPGQISYNRWQNAKGPAVVLAGRGSISAHAAVHAVAALCAHNSVEVLACSAKSAAAWRQLATALGQPALLHVVSVPDAATLVHHLLQVQIATVIFDGWARDWSPVLPFAVPSAPASQAAPREHLRTVLTPGIWPPLDHPELVLRSHLHATSLAINTMRHGAPLQARAVDVHA